MRWCGYACLVTGLLAVVALVVVALLGGFAGSPWTHSARHPADATGPAPAQAPSSTPGAQDCLDFLPNCSEVQRVGACSLLGSSLCRRSCGQCDAPLLPLPSSSSCVDIGGPVCVTIRQAGACATIGRAVCRNTCGFCETIAGSNVTSRDDACNDIMDGCPRINQLGLCSTVGLVACRKTCGHCDGINEAPQVTSTKPPWENSPWSSLIPCADIGDACQGIKNSGFCGLLGSSICRKTCGLCKESHDVFHHGMVGELSTTSLEPRSSTLAVDVTAPFAETSHGPTFISEFSEFNGSTTSTRQPGLLSRLLPCSDIGNECPRIVRDNMCPLLGMKICRSSCGICNRASEPDSERPTTFAGNVSGDGESSQTTWKPSAPASLSTTIIPGHFDCSDTGIGCSSISQLGLCGFLGRLGCQKTCKRCVDGESEAGPSLRGASP
eukprot:TRINITY_DN19668_c0_g1_i1.p1 TRINITY_DN19668_c0_g1~~TRINITY_DN19668_c0_g1_i1.p1  ORF type:complete len:438 (+),score=24.40 TRINITY_DN19668_c0_g1_i1:39-1352(+)